MAGASSSSDTGDVLTREQAKGLLVVPDDPEGKTRLRHFGAVGWLRPAPTGARLSISIFRGDPDARWQVGHRGPPWQGRPHQDGGGPDLREAGNQRLDDRG